MSEKKFVETEVLTLEILEQAKIIKIQDNCDIWFTLSSIQTVLGFLRSPLITKLV